ncbi:unnamed protein product [Durusdinium trenchii]|uniref:Uncharacterized protein n=1 Tax=Durusdinium trenchii TaxID=1381693 RepID=A0ABP0I2Z5_9DINO
MADRPTTEPNEPTNEPRETRPKPRPPRPRSKECWVRPEDLKDLSDDETSNEAEEVKGKCEARETSDAPEGRSRKRSASVLDPPIHSMPEKRRRKMPGARVAFNDHVDEIDPDFGIFG